jgi:hypothetical protein
MRGPGYGILGDAVSGREIAGDEIGLIAGCGDHDGVGMKLFQQGEIGLQLADSLRTIEDHYISLIHLQNLGGWRPLTQGTTQ